MRIRALSIENFRAIENFNAAELTDFVVIAGPNGCGKSTVFDAIRLLKSVYVHEEWKRWFGEFRINVERGANFIPLFRDGVGPARIQATFELSEEERTFLRDHAPSVALSIVLQREEGNRTVTAEPPILPPSLSDERVQALQSEAGVFERAIIEHLDRSQRFAAAVTVTGTPRLEVVPSAVAVAAFTCFDPEHLGEIEFHGSRRAYDRESVTNVRLKVGDRSEERRSRFLYDWENKYKHVKTQLGEEFVASILRKEDPARAPLQSSIKELFRTFFPGKEFEGVQLGGDNEMQFPVVLNTGERHDIDELSSGEKEIVYGYLWLRTGTPRRSVILVDEPELHLNPALVQGLTAFYKTHLADALDAQVWIVTHSDAILRQAVRASEMTVYHMAKPGGEGDNQGIEIDSQDQVEAAVLDLIGDLAAYRPHARIVLVEGQKETRFDVDMIRRLFPDFAERGNFIPAGNRTVTAGVRVRLLEILEAAGLAGRAVSITDGDLGLGDERARGQFAWPVYEIENFLLDCRVLRGAAASMLRDDPFRSDQAVIDTLRDLARGHVDGLACIEVQHTLNREFMRSLNVGGDPSNPVPGLAQSAHASQERVSSVDTSEDRIRHLFDAASHRLRGYLGSEEFIERFPGESLLRAFAGALRISGEHFRNACLDQAVRIGYRPAGMERTLRDALES